MPYTYTGNVSLDRFDQISLQLDNGSTAIIRRGHTYSLSPTELARARQYVVMADSASVAEPLVVTSRLPVVGDLQDGQIPVWNSALGAFVPGDVGTGGGGDGTGNARVLIWDDATSNYTPAEYRIDTSVPREFVGPVDPATIPTIVGPVFGDRWTPTSS